MWSGQWEQNNEEIFVARNRYCSWLWETFSLFLSNRSHKLPTCFFFRYFENKSWFVRDAVNHFRRKIQTICTVMYNKIDD